MTVIAFIVILICMTIVPGCSPGEKPVMPTGSQTQVLPSPTQPTPDATEKVCSRLLEVESFSLTKESLRLNYRVTNVLPHDIWVCVNIHQRENQDSEWSVETEVGGGSLLIRRRGNLKQKCFVTAGDVYAVYYRLPPGASRSDTALLLLPVRSQSPVAFRARSVCPVVLNRVVLELGYFGEELRELLPKTDPSQPYTRVHRYGYFKDPDTAFISYIIPRRWEQLSFEQSVQISISGVNVPGLQGAD
jgi:hypothetical protein